jgi:hypothetical protein
VTPKRILPRVEPHHTSLGLPTVMDRDLAASHGIDYVHLAVFAIDVDRAYWCDPETARLPFGWEVFLTEWYLLSSLDPTRDAHRDLLEAVCGLIFESTPGEPPLGGQIVFAVYDAVQRGAWPSSLVTLFADWRSPPRDLVESLTSLHAGAGAQAARCAQHCLDTELSPPLAPPTREALLQIVAGRQKPLSST